MGAWNEAIRIQHEISLASFQAMDLGMKPHLPTCTPLVLDTKVILDSQVMVDDSLCI